MKNTNINTLLEKSNYKKYSFVNDFNKIIKAKISGYDGTNEDKLKSFLLDLQKGGCSSGIVGDFIYNSDCKQFYIKHIDDLEDMKSDLQDALGEPILNSSNLHYTFMCWLCFEEYCYDLYREIFEN